MKAKRNIVIGATAAQVKAAIGVTPEDERIVREVLARGAEPRSVARRIACSRFPTQGQDVCAASSIFFPSAAPRCTASTGSHSPGRRVCRGSTCHDGTVDGILRALSDCFGTLGTQPPPGKVRRLHDIVLQRAHEVRRQTGAADLFTPTLFRRTTLIALHVAQDMGLVP